MRLVFFGTPDVAVASLRAVLASPHEVVGIVTQPDRIRGRGRSVQPSPVKALATERGLPVLQPDSPKEPAFADDLRTLAPEVLAVVAYGHILPRAVLDVAPAMNVHFSLLPSYRGAAPVQRALMDGATETGVSVFLLEPTVDTGPVLVTERLAIGDEDTAGDLFERMAPVGADALVRALDAFASGTATPQPQDDALASPAPKITPEETQLDWAGSAQRVVNTIRGLSPKPGAWTTFRGKRLGVLRARVVAGHGIPGAIIAVDNAGITVAAGEGAVLLREVVPEGKRAMPAADFARGARPEVGERTQRPG